MKQLSGWIKQAEHPFHTLLYLEWILLGIALLTTFAPPPHVALHPFPPPPPPGGMPPPFPPKASPPIRFIPGIIASIASLGLMGLRLPKRDHPLMHQSLYTILGFAISGLAVCFGGRGPNFFSALLLVVVIRGCLMFSGRGRIIVAIVAYVSFLGMLTGTVLKRAGIFDRSWYSLPHPFFSPHFQYVFHLILNSAILFGLILVFILLLVGTLLSEKQSRQELNHAHRQLRQYALLVENQAALQERNRIAREIHDSVGHYLTAQSIQLQNAVVFLAEDPLKVGGYLKEAQRLGKEALKEVRHSVSALRADPLKGKTLEVALKELVNEMKQTTGIRFESKIKLKSILPSDRSTAIYRVIQEALTNIARHSQATKVQVYLMETSSMIYLRLEDNGQGFEPRENSTGFGLRGMQERIEAIGGKFELKSHTGQGCQLQADIPLLPKRS